MTSSIKENPKLRAAAEELHKAGVKVGDAVSEALRTMEESELMRAVRPLHVFHFSGGLETRTYRSPEHPRRSRRR